MLGLTLLACHMVGDFVLQTRWQAARKLDDAGALMRHVLAYTVPFVPVAFIAASWVHALQFLLALFWLHFLTDSRRFYSTLGEWIAHRVGVWWLRRAGTVVEDYVLPPNPWPPMPLLIDQSLHVVQIAALGWLLT